MKKFEEVFNVEWVLTEAKSAFYQFVGDVEGDYYDRFDDRFLMYICTLVSGSYGIYMPGAICDIFGVLPNEIDEEVKQRVDEDGDIEYFLESRQEWLSAEEWINSYEWIHDFIMYDIESNMCDGINATLRELNIPAYLYIGYHESDGSYCLFLNADGNDIVDIREGIIATCHDCGHGVACRSLWKQG